MKKIIIYNPYNVSSIFFLAAAKNAGYTLVSTTTPSALWASGAKEIILCNIDPKSITSSIQYHPDIEIYLSEKINLISHIIFFPFDNWEKDNTDIDELMTKIYTKSMRKKDGDMASDNWQTNLEVSRYVKALKTAMIKGLNSNLAIYEAIYEEVITEIASERTSPLVESFYELYHRAQKITNKAIKSLKINFLIRIPGRKIGFTYLDNISEYLDFSRLREAFLEKSPYLTVIQYKDGGEDFTWLLSNNKLEVCQFFRLPKAKKFETIIKAPHKKVLRHLQQVIAELQK